jgi:hypothetical protein
MDQLTTLLKANTVVSPVSTIVIIYQTRETEFHHNHREEI